MFQLADNEAVEDVGGAIRRAIDAALQEGQLDTAAALRSVLLIVPVEHGGGAMTA